MLLRDRIAEHFASIKASFFLMFLTKKIEIILYLFYKIEGLNILNNFNNLL